MNPLFILRNPRHFKEASIQNAIKEAWDYLFTDFQVVSRSGLVDESWCPDTVAYSDRDKCWLIIEVKAIHQCSPKGATLNQITGYAQRLAESRPGDRIKLLVLGRWEGEEVVFNGWAVHFFPVGSIGQYLTAEYAECLLGHVVPARVDLAAACFLEDYI